MVKEKKYHKYASITSFKGKNGNDKGFSNPNSVEYGLNHALDEEIPISNLVMWKGNFNSRCMKSLDYLIRPKQYEVLFQKRKGLFEYKGVHKV